MLHKAPLRVMADKELSREEQAKKDERISQIVSELQASREKQARDENLPLTPTPTNIVDTATEQYEAEQKKGKK